MNVLRIGETSHGADFRVLREKGYPHYLLLLVETPALFEVDGEWVRTPAHTAFLFRPGQRHSYRAAGEGYTDCWMHLASESPLLFEAFPFGRPIPLFSAERFYGLFRILTDEFFFRPPHAGGRRQLALLGAHRDDRLRGGGQKPALLSLSCPAGGGIPFAHARMERGAGGKIARRERRLLPRRL